MLDYLQSSQSSATLTRIVRESDYSPASALFSEIVEKKWCTKSANKSLPLLMCIQNLIKFCPSVLKILSRNDILTSIKGRNAVTNCENDG